MKIPHWIKDNKARIIITFIFLIFFYFCLPRKLFDNPYSTVIESAQGDLLAARIAEDGQWRFPAQDSVPYKFRQGVHCAF